MAKIIKVNVSFSRSIDPNLSRIGYKIPQFFDESGLPYTTENTYLRFASFRLREKSLKTVSEHLLELLQWRINNEIEVEDFSDVSLEHYIDAQCSYIQKGGALLAWNTVNSRIGGAYRFLSWCRKRAINVVFTTESHFYPRDGAARVVKASGHPSTQLRAPTKFLLLDVAVELIHALGNISGAFAANRQRNQLIARLMLQCGLRVSEALNFSLQDLPSIRQTQICTEARIIGKGNKLRYILIPNDLLAGLWEYVDLGRARIIERNSMSAGSNTPNIFISNKGKPITANWIERLISKAGTSLGIHAYPHILRHTFGTYHYLHNQDVVLLAQLMGHEHVETTEKYYIHTAKLISSAGTYAQFQSEVDHMLAKVP